MANDMQWPSEDEDFDAKTDTAKIKALGDQPEKLVAKPVEKPLNRVSVAVSEPDAHQTEEVNQIDPDIERVFAEPVQSRDQLDPAEESAQPEQTDEPQQPEDQIQEPVAQQDDHEAHEALREDQTVNNATDQYKPDTKPARAPKSKAGMARTIFEVVLVVALLGAAYHAHALQNDKKDLTAKVATLNANPQIAIQKQTEELISKVGALINLPSGEAPTVANVSDATKAKQQSSFFDNAQNGDKVLMYVKAGEAILYRPSTNKIILVAPLTFNADATTKTTTPTTNVTTPTTRR